MGTAISSQEERDVECEEEELGACRTWSTRHCVNGKCHAAAGCRPNLLPDQESRKEKISATKLSERSWNNTDRGVQKHVSKGHVTSFGYECMFVLKMAVIVFVVELVNCQCEFL